MVLHLSRGRCGTHGQGEETQLGGLCQLGWCRCCPSPCSVTSLGHVGELVKDGGDARVRS